MTRAAARGSIGAVSKEKFAVAVVVTAFAAAFAAAAFFLLPADGFFSCDEGIKFIQLRSVIDNGWTDARLIWPGDGARLDRRFIVTPRFIEERRGGLYTPHPLLFTLATAPLYAAAGLGGIYFWPVVGGVAVVAFAGALAISFSVRPPWLAAALVAFATPIGFYAVCYWEHLPALALWLTGFYLLTKPSRRRVVGTAVAWGLAAELRPEAYWLVAWTAASLIIFLRERWHTFAFACGAAAVLGAATELLLYAGWGQPPFIRFGANAAYSGWAGPAGFPYAFNHSVAALKPWPAAAVLTLVAALALIGLKWRWGPVVAAVAGAALVFIYWKFYDGFATAATATFPALFALLFLSRPAGQQLFSRVPAAEKAFYLSAGGFAATLFLIIPDTSGFAWGPRFILYIFPAAAIALARLAAGVPEGKLYRRITAAAWLTLAALSVATQYQGWARLVDTKRVNAALTRALPAGGILLTDKWYIPLYAAPRFGETVFLIADDERKLAAATSAAGKRAPKRFYFLTDMPTTAEEARLYADALTSALDRHAVVIDSYNVAAFASRRHYNFPFRIWALTAK